MRRFLLNGLLAWLVLCSFAVSAEVPKLLGRVNDYANVMNDADKASLESTLSRHEEDTTNQLVVLTVDTLDGEPIETFADKVFNTWKLGQAGKDNGVLFIVAVKDHHMRIEVGKGLEGDLPDAMCAKVLRENAKPEFRANRYDSGIVSTMTVLVSLLNSPAARAEYVDKSPSVATIILVSIAVVGAVIVVLWLIAILVGPSRPTRASYTSYSSGSASGRSSGGGSASLFDSDLSGGSSSFFDGGSSGDSGFSGGGGGSFGGGSSDSW